MKVMSNHMELKSKISIQQCFVRFVNKTIRQVTVVWINYEGVRVSYKILAPEEGLDVNTFVSHPWVFEDHVTGQPLVVCSSEVFYPRPCFRRIDRNPPVAVRMLVHITIPVYSLRDLCIHYIRHCLKSRGEALCLEIPYCLQEELVGDLDDIDWKYTKCNFFFFSNITLILKVPSFDASFSCLFFPCCDAFTDHLMWFRLNRIINVSRISRFSWLFYLHVSRLSNCPSGQKYGSVLFSILFRGCTGGFGLNVVYYCRCTGEVQSKRMPVIYMEVSLKYLQGCERICRSCRKTARLQHKSFFAQRKKIAASSTFVRKFSSILNITSHLIDVFS